MDGVAPAEDGKPVVADAIGFSPSLGRNAKMTCSAPTLFKGLGSLQKSGDPSVRTFLVVFARTFTGVCAGN